MRASAAAGATRATNAISRRLGLGSGTVVGGRVGLVIDPGLLSRLAAGRTVALVSGTNGKTTTTRLLARALQASGTAVVSNDTGSNMPPGHLACLVAGPRQAPAVLEVDEAYLPRLAGELHPKVVVLLNLSRDQLDRTNEVRMLAGRWRGTLASAQDLVVVANADDPLVAWAAHEAGDVRWVAAGIGWRNDAVGCPACLGRIVFDAAAPSGEVPGRWRCTSCTLERPAPHAWLEPLDAAPPLDAARAPETAAVWDDGRRIPLVLALPGRFNRANALMSAVAAEALGCPPDRSLAAMADVEQVAGRFTVRRWAGVSARLLLAKNPAGWAELLELVRIGEDPVVVAINARVADGRDPSWLWDVPFDVLAGRVVVASGERWADLSVRLRYAGVDHQVAADPVEAVRLAAQLGGPSSRAGSEPVVQFVGNYTAFHDLLRRR